VADSSYADTAEFRPGLADRDVSYVVQVPVLNAYSADARRTISERGRVGRPPQLCYRDGDLWGAA
jgi:hypothetical protein